ncbi:MAG TPA: right-handed parallel beta-helix repeat-containing protein [Holophagaceae bacterium]|nr:right-handed parallel beta-helix repeat-containing protein [Holophagaceae bacterium]
MRPIYPAIVLSLVLIGCSGGSPEASKSTSTSTPTPTPPATPFITAPTSAIEGSTGLSASVHAQPDTTYRWSIDSGTLTSSSESPTVTFNVGTTDTTLVCYAVNSGGTSNARTTVRVSKKAPTQPTITAPSQVTAGGSGYAASIAAQSGCTYAWTATNGTIQGGQGTTAITFSAGTGSSLQLQCVVTNAAGSATGTQSITVVPALAPPTTPTITAPSTTIEATSGYAASVATQSGCTYAWTITNGTIQSGQGTAALQFKAGVAGTPLQLGCTVGNAAGSVVGTKSVTVSPAATPVAVTLTPALVTLSSGMPQVFTAAVSGTTNTAVTWTVDGIANGNATVGTIGGTGNSVTYTAPLVSGTHTIVAKSVADTTRSDSSTITVQSGCAPAPTSTQTLNVLDATYGAKGNGVADDTAAIQKAINAVGAGGTVYIPDGTYMINPIAIPTGGNHGLALKSNMTLRLSSGAVLKATTNSAGTYAIVMAQNVTGVNIVGGTIMGDRATHTGTTGEWGMGISLIGAHQAVIEGVTAKECWGDGFYVSGGSTDVTLCNVIADHNRRLGMAITSVDGMVVRNSTFINTAGTAPEAGIDLEPNPGETVANLLITNCTLNNNAGNGFEGGVPIANTGLAFLVNVVFDSNTVSGNGVNPEDGQIRNGVLLSNSDGTKITNNLITTTTGRGILLRDKATHTTISGNTVTKTITIPGNTFWSGGGIYLGTCAYSTITGNIVKDNSGYGIQQTATDSTVVISNNTVTGNGMVP